MVEFFDLPGVQKCPFCPGSHATYQCGPPAKVKGVPHVVGDKLAKHMDWAAGREFSSRSERKRVYKNMGLNLTSAAELRRKHGMLRKIGGIYSYAGQKDHRSSAEKPLVTTKDGVEVV